VLSFYDGRSVYYSLAGRAERSQHHEQVYFSLSLCYDGSPPCNEAERWLGETMSATCVASSAYELCAGMEAVLPLHPILFGNYSFAVGTPSVAAAEEHPTM
jgi:hypothetical protein